MAGLEQKSPRDTNREDKNPEAKCLLETAPFKPAAVDGYLWLIARKDHCYINLFLSIIVARKCVYS